MYLKKFSRDQRQNSAPATRSMGVCMSVVTSGTCRPLSGRRRIWRTSGPPDSVIRFSASRTSAVRNLDRGAAVRNSPSGQGSPPNPLCQAITAILRRARRANSAGLQRSNTSVSAAASPLARSGAPAGRSSAGRMSCSSACVMVGSLCRHRSGLPPSALTQQLIKAGRQSCDTKCFCRRPLRPEYTFTCSSTDSVARPRSRPARPASPGPAAGRSQAS